MRLRELLHGVEVIRQNVPESLEITGVSCDSREMEKDSIFVAIPGNRCDGGDYALEALKRGAAAVVCQGKPPENLPRGAPLILVPDARKALAHLACNWYGNPAKSLKLIGVTGTNGKTTTTYLIKHILEATGEKTGLIGTVENRAGEERFPARRTTPNALEIQKILGKMVTNRCKFGVMEVSSHALLQDRTENIPFTVGVFTNLTEDHLDYHKTMEHYCDAKAKLFRHCRTAACNGDDPWRQRILAGSRCPVLLYGLGEEADLRGEDIRLSAGGWNSPSGKTKKESLCRWVCRGGFRCIIPWGPWLRAGCWEFRRRPAPRPCGPFPGSRAAWRWYPHRESPIPSS